MHRLIAALTLAIPAILGFSAPAAAQDVDYRVNQLIVYGDDECPASTGDEITVCARKDESERYRIPEDLRTSQDPANTAWTEKVLAYETVGDAGIMSCSPTGAGGSFGCTEKLIQKAYAEKENASSVRFGELIAEQRAERLSTLDEEAAEMQSRVEEEEAKYDARKAAEAEASADTPVDSAEGQDQDETGTEAE